MGRGQSGYRYPRCRAAHVIQADPVAKADGIRMAAVFAADAHVHLGTDLLAPFHGELHELTHALDIQHFEGVVLQDPRLAIQG